MSKEQSDKRDEVRRHERRVVGHASGWQEQMDTCVCGKPWPCASVASTTPQKPDETPRTDALSVKLHDLTGGFKPIDLWDHARQLERELAEVRGAFRRSDAENDELRQENGALSTASAIAPSADMVAQARAQLMSVVKPREDGGCTCGPCKLAREVLRLAQNNSPDGTTNTPKDPKRE